MPDSLPGQTLLFPSAKRIVTSRPFRMAPRPKLNGPRRGSEPCLNSCFVIGSARESPREKNNSRRPSFGSRFWRTAACFPAHTTISHMSNNNWTQGLASFTGAMTISGGEAPFSIVSDGNLPAGVAPVISGDTIRFSGTTSVAKDFNNCTVTIKDASGAKASRTFVIDVEPALVVGNLTQSQWTVDQAGFTGAMKISGGTGAYSLVQRHWPSDRPYRPPGQREGLFHRHANRRRRFYQRHCQSCRCRRRHRDPDFRNHHQPRRPSVS